MVMPKTPPFTPDAIENHCRCLGLHDDADTALGFSSRWNYCHKSSPVKIPTLEIQRKICLETEHRTCPIFLAEEKKSLPKDWRMPDLAKRIRIIKRWITISILFFFLIASGLLLSGIWAPDWVGKIQLPEAKPTITPRVIQTYTPQVTALPNTPTATKESPTPTKEPFFSSLCAYPLETPIGEIQQFLIHKVEYGESMTVLTAHYQTTAAAIDAVNYFLPSPLWAEQEIVIPLNTTSIEGLSSLKPVFVDRDDISLEDLAKKLRTSPSELIEFNHQDEACRSFHGWVLVPTKKK